MLPRLLTAAVLLLAAVSARAATLVTVRQRGLMLEAEELGITSANAAQMLAESPNPTVRRLLGRIGDFGTLIGLNNARAFDIIKQVGNYDESYDRNVGPGSALKLERGPNALWTYGGLMYAIPFR